LFDVVIRGGALIDGTGSPWFQADIGIEDGRIAAISRTPFAESVETRQTVDATGLVVAPGFIDFHTHSDWTALSHPGCQNYLRQGVTTELVGQCGISFYPIDPFGEAGVRRRIVSWDGVDPGPDCADLESWRQLLHAQRIGNNLVPFVGHNTLRTVAMGSEGRGGERHEPTSDEVEHMHRLLEEALAQGAFGLSSGLVYTPGRNAHTEEVVGLAKVVARHGGVYTTHQRSQFEGLIEATDETITIARASGAPTCVAHLKAVGRSNWGKPIEVLRMLDRARRDGIDIVCELYPWAIPHIRPLAGLLRHPGTPSATRESLLTLLRDDAAWAALKQRLQESDATSAAALAHAAWLRRHGLAQESLLPFEERAVSYSVSSPDLVGLTLSEIATRRGAADAWDVARAIYLEDEGTTLSGGGGQACSEDDLQAILAHPLAAVGTDAVARDQLPDLTDPVVPTVVTSPNGWSTFPKVLGEYARDRQLFSLETAVYKMTGLPARFLGLRNRGQLARGYWADITVFDPRTVASVPTPANPCAYPVGIRHVLVNGQLALVEGEPTGQRVGRVLARD
jgi:N-acyl-D-amino-acid deacylase